ncbi:hypothetical protein LTR28_012053 [Elasticomyces elasticus]|nr:hypothetical protein LTR28_012053 [Elasticomyces elasticus]
MAYSEGPSVFDSFHDAVWTRKAGWGSHKGGAYGGAPLGVERGTGGINGHLATSDVLGGMMEDANRHNVPSLIQVAATRSEQLV